MPGDDAAVAHAGLYSANGDASHAGNMAVDVLSSGPEARTQRETQREPDTRLQQECQHGSRWSKTGKLLRDVPASLGTPTKVNPEIKAVEVLCDVDPMRPGLSPDPDLLSVLHRIKGEVLHTLQETAEASKHNTQMVVQAVQDAAETSRKVDRMLASFDARLPPPAGRSRVLAAEPAFEDAHAGCAGIASQVQIITVAVAGKGAEGRGTLS